LGYIWQSAIKLIGQKISDLKHKILNTSLPADVGDGKVDKNANMIEVR
jgi:hypothetical protein